MSDFAYETIKQFKARMDHYQRRRELKRTLAYQALRASGMDEVQALTELMRPAKDLFDEPGLE